MNENRLCCVLALVALFIIGGLTASVAQEPSPKSEAEIRALIKKSISKDLKIAEAANEALSKLDAKSLPAFVSILKRGKACERVAAAKRVIDLDRSNSEWVPAMTEVARGGSLLSIFNLEEEMMCRRAAAFILAFSTEGILY